MSVSDTTKEFPTALDMLPGTEIQMTVKDYSTIRLGANGSKSNGSGISFCKAKRSLNKLLTVS